MSTYLIFGVIARTLDESRDYVEKTLQVKLEARESTYKGGDYYAFGLPDRILSLQNNVDLLDDNSEVNGIAYPEFAKYPYLLFLNRTETIPSMVSAIEMAPNRFIKLRSSQS